METGSKLEQDRDQEAINPYAAPRAELAFEENDKPSFYIVSKKKFTTLFFMTIGAYMVYWFYRNWKLYKDNNQESIWPIPRGIFNIFFTHSLFDRVEEHLTDAGISHSWNHSLTATGIVCLNILSNVLDRAARNEMGSPYTDIISILLLIPLYFLLVKAQAFINLSQSDPQGLKNQHFTPANWFWIVLGVLIWLLVIIGVMTYFETFDLWWSQVLQT